MSEAENQDTSILLPESSVAVYARDGNTLQAARDMENDWRFARVNMQLEEGDVETAIAAYQDLASPDLIIIQTDTIDAAFTERLEALAGNCDEGTSAIIIGPDNDVNLYRKLIDMGVSDYLVRPVETPVLAEVIAKAVIEKVGVTGSRLIAVVGAKGGVGSSVLSSALACGIADILNQKVVLLDTAGGWSSLSVGLGFEPSTTLPEAVRAAQEGNEDNLKRMLHRIGDRLDVLATGADVMLDPSVSADGLEALIDMLMVKSPVVLADLSNSSESLQKVILSRANQILMVTTPTLPALRQARSLLQEIQEVRGGEDSAVELIVNMQGLAAAHEVSKKDIEAAIDHKVSAFVPFEPKAFLGVEGSSLRFSDDKDVRGHLNKSLLPIVKKVISVSVDDGDEDDKKDGILGGLLGKLSSSS